MLNKLIFSKMPYTTTSSLLHKIMEEQVLKSPIAWTKITDSRYSAKLEDGVTAHVFFGSGYMGTNVYVTKGHDTVKRDFESETWLDNWTVEANTAKNDRVKNS